MATSDINKWKEITRGSAHQINVNDFVVSNLDFYVVETKVGSAENYATGGISADLSGNKKRTAIVAFCFVSTGHTAVYNHATKKILVYKNATEVANNATTLHGATITSLVFAR